MDRQLGTRRALGRLDKKGERVGTLPILVIVGLLVWVIFTQVQAREQLNVLSRFGVDETRAAVDAFFGRTWKRVPGPGIVNVRQRLKREAFVLSVDWEQGSKGTEVKIWVSDFHMRTVIGPLLGMMDHAQYAWRKKRQLARRLGGGASDMPADETPADHQLRGPHDQRSVLTSSAVIEPTRQLVTESPSGVPPDWYSDPTGRYEYRYWDGQGWTAHVSSDGQRAHDPIRETRT